MRMITKFTPAFFTLFQSMLLWYLDTSMPKFTFFCITPSASK